MRQLVVVAALAACGHSSSTKLAADASTDVGSADAAPPPCGLRTGMRGTTNRMAMVAGLNRTYIVYLPSGVDPTTPVPLVFVAHGYTMSAQNMVDITGYRQLADREHIAVAFPDGEAGPNSLGAPWNVGTNVCSSTSGPPPLATGDDFAFLDEMKADIAQDQCLDTAHIFATGFSMGGYFSHHVGCMRPDIRAIAPHSGGTHSLENCANAKEPVIIFHGTADAVVPESCDTDAATSWAEHNGCATTTTSRAVNNGTCLTYDSCPAGGQVELCTFTNMPHCWAGGLGSNVFACNNYESATELEWAFFKQYAW